MKRKLWTTIGIAALCGIYSVANSAIILDDEGVGFVGKGDVQLMFGWNNAQLQTCATSKPADPINDAECLWFGYYSESVEVTEQSWECKNTNNQKIQERTRTTTTTIYTGGISASVARVKNQVTGFNLNGGDFVPTELKETDGPALNSCPSGPWVLSTPAGDPVEVSDESSNGGSRLTVTDTRNGASHTVDVE